MSFKGKLIHYALKNRHIIKGRLKPDVIDKNTSIEKLRYENDMMAEKLAKKIEGIKYEKTNFPDFYSEWVKFDGAPEEKIILYFHGGGFVMGNAKSHRNLVGNFVKNLGVNALVFDYSLAPEYPAPRAVKDSFKIYKWLLDNGYKVLILGSQEILPVAELLLQLCLCVKISMKFFLEYVGYFHLVLI